MQVNNLILNYTQISNKLNLNKKEQKQNITSQFKPSLFVFPKVSFCANIDIKDSEECLNILKNAKLNGRKRFSDKEISSIQKEVARYDSKLKKSELLKLLVDCGEKDKNGALISGFTMFEIASAFSLSSGAKKEYQLDLMKFMNGYMNNAIALGEDTLDEFNEFLLDKIDENPKLLELISIVQNIAPPIESSQNALKAYNLFALFDTNDEKYYKLIPAVDAKLKEDVPYDIIFELNDYFQYDIFKQILKYINSSNLHLIQDALRYRTYNGDELVARLKVINNPAQNSISRQNFDFANIYPDKPAPKFAIVDDFTNSSVSLLNSDSCTHGELVSSVVKASSSKAEISGYNILTINNEMSLYDADKLIRKYLNYKDDKDITFFNEHVMTFLKVLEDIDKGKKYDALNYSFGCELTFEKLNEKFEPLCLNSDNVANHKKEMLEILADSDDVSDKILYTEICLINEIVKRGVKVYIAGGNESKCSFNLLNLANVEAVGALTLSKKKTRYSTDNSAITGWGMGNYPIKAVEDRNGIIGYSLLGDGVADIQNITNCNDVKYDYSVVEERCIKGGTSSATPRKMVEDYYLKK